MPPRNNRTWRLVGEPGLSDREHGGGVEVVTLFTMLLETAVDTGRLDLAGVTTEVRRRYDYKRARLRILYGIQDPYPGFTKDGIDQLVEGGYVTGDTLEPTGAVKLGEPLTVVPGEDSTQVQVTIYPAEIRKLREQLVGNGHRTAAELAQDLRPDRPGLRAFDQAHVAELVQSMQNNGFLAEFPILRDQHGRVLDGRHRLAAAAAAAVRSRDRVVQVESDEEAIAIALAANQNKPWSTTEWQRLSGMAGSFGINVRNEMRRKWIMWEVEHGPARSNREIAEIVGCDKNVVSRLRAAESTPATGAAHQSPVVSDANKSERVQVALRADPTLDNESIAAIAGTIPDTVRKQRAKLAGAGAIPAVPKKDQRRDIPTGSASVQHPISRAAQINKPAGRRKVQIEGTRAGDPEYMADRIVAICQESDRPLGALLLEIAAALERRAGNIARIV